MLELPTDSDLGVSGQAIVTTPVNAKQKPSNMLLSDLKLKLSG